MRKLVAFVIVLILLALVGGAAYVALFGVGGGRATTEVPDEVAEQDDANASRSGGRERVRVGKDSTAHSPEPAAPKREPVVEPVEVVAESDSSGTLTVVLSGTDRPAAGVDIAFMPIDPSSPDEALRGLEGDALFAAAAEHGTRLRTGMDGAVRVPSFEGYARVFARSGELRGQAWIQPGKDEWSLTLSPVLFVDVRVVTSGGAAAAGVPVAVRVGQDGGHWPVARAITGTDGRARIEFQVDDQSQGAFDVAALVPGREALHVTIDPDALPEDPVELRLPAGGTLRVEVVGPDGAVWREPAQVTVRAEARVEGVRFANVEDDPAATTLPTIDGVATFQHIGVRTRLEVSVRGRSGDRGARSETIDGPAAAGDEVVHRIEIGALRPTVTGRMEYDDGTPAAGVEIVAELLIPGNEVLGPWGRRLSCTTDDSGGFSFVLDTLPADDEKAALQIGRPVQSGVGAFDTKMLATKPLVGLRSDVSNDLGTIIIVRPLLLVSGRVVGPDGAPLAATVAVINVHGWGTTLADDADVTTADSAGRFAIEGTTESATLRLGATAKGYFLDEMPSVARGATDVTVRMSRAGALAGSVKIPDGMDAWSIQLVAEGDVSNTHGAAYSSANAEVTTNPASDGTFTFDSLRPGTATVQVRIGWNDEDTVLTVENLTVVGGETLRDPRLQDLDLAALLGGFAITVLDAEREPLPDAVVHARRGGGGHDAQWREFECDASGVAHVRIQADAVDVLAMSHGHRAGELSAVTGDRAIVLQKGSATRVTVRLSADTPLPDPPHELQVQLDWVGALGTSGQGDRWGHDPRSSDFGLAQEQAFGRTREVTVTVLHPGRYRVQLMLWEREIRSASGSGVDTMPDIVIVTVPGDGTPITQEIAADADALRRRTR